MNDYALPAFAQLQYWHGDAAVDAEEMVYFDAEPHLLAMSGADFSMAAAEILSGGHDLDEIGLKIEAVSDWCDGGDDATFYCEVDRHVFEEWLQKHGVEQHQVFTMMDAQMEDLRAAVAASRQMPVGI